MVKPKSGNHGDAHSVEPLFFSVDEAAATLGLGRTSTYALINDGTLKSRKVGRRRLVWAESVRDLAPD